ncbi:SAM-dependent methyltransferase [Actinomadura sp. HBU206391]|uniref:SAM-dependent methyltransferase n=1 Tax=Actinomadura sp. HBU206391 TaxID=2731692 RepID=UPI002905F526|nr:SAM-dependent methyltransferase [Actinomadura sp. HBU206391]
MPALLDVSKPHSARVYDYYLGGKDNYEIDRATGERAAKSWPAVRTAVRENRAFLGRAVRFLVQEAGIRQFLDIGTGLPSGNNVHQIAQSLEPTSRVVYVDNDPIVLVHANALLTSRPEGKTSYIDADLRDPRGILDDPAVSGTLDFDEPIALMLVAILHFLTDDDDPRHIVSTLLEALPAGSYFTASHVTPEHDPDGVRGLESTYRAGGIPAQARDSATFTELAFAGLDVVDPGVTLVSEWRPDPGHSRPPAGQVNWYGGVARI